MNTISVPFHDTLIPCVQVGETFYVFVKPICEYLGVDFKSQQTRIKAHPILGDVVGVHPLHDTSGRLQKSVSIPNHHLHGWLFSIDINKLAEESAKEKLLLFQRECYEALFHYFTGAERVAIRNIRRDHELKQEQAALVDKMEEVRDLLTGLRSQYDDIEKEREELRSDSHRQLCLPLATA